MALHMSVLGLVEQNYYKVTALIHNEPFQLQTVCIVYMELIPLASACVITEIKTHVVVLHFFNPGGYLFQTYSVLRGALLLFFDKPIVFPLCANLFSKRLADEAGPPAPAAAGLQPQEFSGPTPKLVSF